VKVRSLDASGNGTGGLSGNWRHRQRASGSFDVGVELARYERSAMPLDPLG
jgi:hypothetical protein